MSTGRLHLIDGTFELFRAHYSKRPPHVGPDGKDKKATAGLLSSLVALLHDEVEAVSHVAIAFDNPIRSFRNRLFDGYKTEAGVPPELLAQFDLAEEAARALGIAVWSMSEYEADDALATGAARFSSEVQQVRLLTPDKDLGQCVRGTSVIQVDRIRKKEIDEAAVRAARGVGPESVPDLLALVGDDADGIPGLPGFGAKSAAVLLARYRRIEAIPARASEWDVQLRGAEQLALTLNERREDALLYRTLATLVDSVPLPETHLEHLAFAGVPKDGFRSFCDSIGLGALKDRLTRWRG